MVRNKTNSSPAIESRKAEILKEAMKLFAEKGYQVASLDEVASNIGVTKAALYYYFDSKSTILGEIIKISIGRMKKAIDLEKSPLPPEQKLHKFIEALVEDNTDTLELAKIITEQANNLPKKAGDLVNRKKKEVDTTLQKILQEGVDRDVFSVSDVKLVSFAIIGLCDWTYHWYKPDGRLSPERISRIFIDLVENGLLKH